ncbi:MAG: glutamate racemase [Treponema sp.]|nr:glutamate racemase [Treponema sp.]
MRSDKVDFAFLDSGTGGIPYMISLHKKMPDAKCVYLGDTANFPYGEKSPGQVTSCSSKTIRKIVSLWSPKVIVIACNTISVTALEELRKLFPEISIIGTVPAIKLGAKVSKNKRIGLLATNATVKHPYCQRLIEDFASDCFVAKRGDPELVDFIEKKYFTASEEERLEAVKPAADFFKSQNCDTVILGCTHFTHIFNEMKKACGSDVKVVDSRDGVANQALRKLKSELENNSESENGTELKKSEFDSKLKTEIGKMSENLETDSNSQPEIDSKSEIASKSNPNLKNLTFFVTKANQKEILEYEILCRNMNIPWGGII